MTYATALALIQAEIIANGNNEITANVLRPVLEAMIDFPNDVIGVLADLNTSDTTSIVNAINSIVSQNLPNATALRPIDTTGVDFNQDELLWVRDAINQTATNNGAFTCNLGEQMVFFCDVLIDIVGTEANIQRRYYRLTTGATLVNSLGSTLTPPLMPDGSSFNTIELTGDLVIDLGNIGTDDIEVAFNSHANQPFTILGDKFIQAIQNGESQLWQWIGGDGDFGNSATLAVATDFVLLTEGGGGIPLTGVETVTGDSVDNTDPLNPVVNAIPLSGTEVGSPVTGDIEIEDAVKIFPTSGGGGYYIGTLADDDTSFLRITPTSREVIIGVLDAPVLSKGLIGSHYYGANYDDNTYVQKKYVDDLIATTLPTENQINGVKIASNVTVAQDIDLNAASDFHYTMTAGTAFTFTNTPTGNEVKRCKIRLTGEFAATWTQAGLQVFGDGYDGTKWNDILVEMWLDGTIKGLLIFQQRETA